MNARKVVEPVCLDFLVKWRGDEETGRDQIDEILREVVVITDSEQEDENDDGSEDETDESSTTEDEISTEHKQHDPNPLRAPGSIRFRDPGFVKVQSQSAATSIYPLDSHSDDPGRHALKERRIGNVRTRQRGFTRYQAAWDQAIVRNRGASNTAPATSHARSSTMLDRPTPKDYHMERQFEQRMQREGMMVRS